MGKESRNSGRVERFQEIRSIRPQQSPSAAAIPGYLNLGVDEDGLQEVLFLPICRRILIEPPDENGAELVTIMIEDGERVTYGPAQSRAFLLGTGIRKEEPGLIEIPDIARPKGLGM